MENKAENKALKISKIVLNALFYLLLLLLLLFSISNLGVKEVDDVPGIFGRGFLTVLSDSMDGDKEDSFTVKDLLIVKVVKESNREKLVGSLEQGDIITFVDTNATLGDFLNTHRIVNTGQDSNGKKYFVTQGDKNAMDHPYWASEGVKNTDGGIVTEVVYFDDVVAVCTGSWNGFGGVMKYLKSSTGFLVCIVVPTALFFVLQAVLLVLNILKVNKEKMSAQLEGEKAAIKAQTELDLEKEKERIRQELLAEMQKEKEDKPE